MTYDTETLGKDSVRVFVTGQCDGLPELREALGKHPEIELVGWADNVMEGASTLTGGTDQTFSLILRMTDNQAQKFELVLAETQNKANGVTWHLALRPVVDAADSHDHLDSPRTVMGDGIPAAERRAFFGGAR